MLLSFPQMLPDELFYSCCARYHNESGNINLSQTMNDLFGNPNLILNPTFPKALDYFLNQLGNIHLDQIINNHTIFPVFVPFLDNFRVNALMKIFKGESKNYANHIIGIKNDLRITSLRYCTLCISNDEKIYGTPFWHRSHQLPRADICFRHKSILQTHCPVCSSVFRPKKGNLIRLRRFCNNGHDLTKINKIGSQRLSHDDQLIYEISKELDHLLKYPKPQYNWHDIYKIGLENKGYSSKSGRVDLMRLRNEIA